MSGEESLPAAIEEVEEGWSPRGEADVERALRGLERLSARFQAVRGQAMEWTADIQAWEAAEVVRIRKAATPIVLGLQAWGRERRLLSHGKEKSFRFPSGTITTRSGRGKAEVTDEAALLAWCEEQGSGALSAIKVTKAVLTSVLLKLDGIEVLDDGRVAHLGEVIPGLRFHVAHEANFSVSVDLASQRALPLGSSE
jgi:phage host-nuclease inhibitor protein Gam